MKFHWLLSLIKHKDKSILPAIYKRQELMIVGGVSLLIILIGAAGFSTQLLLSRTSKQAELIASQQAALIQTQEQIAELKASNAKLADYLQIETKSLQERISEEESKRLEAEESRDRGSVTNIVNSWRPLIVSVQCRFSGTTQRGSGTLAQESGLLKVVTNNHVVTNKGVAPTDCTIRFPGETSQVVTIEKDTIRTGAGGLDLATIYIRKPNASIEAIANKHLGTKNPGFTYCKSAPALGEHIVILGYPAIGSGEDITATEGIVSGFDGNYYVTSAKVERGNSGGAAVNLTSNCYLGIPTFVQTGQIESLARLLKAPLIFN